GPAVIGVRTMAAATHEGNLAVTELVEMAQSQFRRAALVENHVGDSGNFAMPRNRDGREREAMLQDRIDQDETLDRPLHQHARVLFNQVGLATVTGREVEVTFLDERFFYSGEHLCGIAV